jgi:hypothetical protein
MRFPRWLLVWLLPALAVLPGCGPGVSRDQMGKVDREIPEVPGGDQPYPLPELQPDKPADSQAGK